MNLSWWDVPVSNKWLAILVILPIWWLFDRLCPKRKNSWAFFVHPLKSSQFVENSRAVFENIKKDPSIAKYVFTRDSVMDLGVEDAVNTHFIDVQSIKGLLALARCGVYILTNAIALDMSWRWSDGGFSVVRATLKKRIVINLWHGIPLKRLFALANPEQRQRADRVAYRRRERYFYRGLIASSEIDSYAMASMFYPIKYEQVWITGLPRNDFLIMPHDVLPGYLSSEVCYIRSLKKNKRLVLYAPTFRESNFNESKCFQFTHEQVSEIKSLLAIHNAVLGFRMHYFRKEGYLFNLEKYIDGEHILDLGHSVVREISSVLREADVVVTDYSSLYIDALYLDRPVISFAYDLDHYSKHQNGLLYDIDLVFPGSVARTFDRFMESLELELKDNGQAQINSDHYKMCKKLFFNYTDDKNSQRVINRIKKVAVGG